MLLSADISRNRLGASLTSDKKGSFFSFSGRTESLAAFPSPRSNCIMQNSNPCGRSAIRVVATFVCTAFLSFVTGRANHIT